MTMIFKKLLQDELFLWPILLLNTNPPSSFAQDYFLIWFSRHFQNRVFKMALMGSAYMAGGQKISIFDCHLGKSH